MLIERIHVEGNVYLTRLHLTPWSWWPFSFKLYLHIFWRPDQDRYVHDHPWWFWTFCLWGGYAEAIRDPKTGLELIHYVRVLTFHKRSAEFAHRIMYLFKTPTITLVIRGSKERHWGFYTRNGWVRWQDYVDGPRSDD